MEKVLAACRFYSAVYIDDILVFSRSWLEHLAYIKQVLEALRQAGLTAKPTKCQCHLDYLGHRVGSGKVAVPEQRVKALARYKFPVRKKNLRSFLGSVSYYRRFIHHFPVQSSCLTRTTSNKAPDTVQWTPEMLDAFNVLHKCLCNVCVLTVPSFLDVFKLHTDASGQGLGSVLNVVCGDEVLPVAFQSRQLKGAEHN